MFYGGPFSNFAHSPITIDGKEYPTVEHWFQASKAPTPVGHEYVRAAPDPGSAKALGRSIRLRHDWEVVKVAIMLRGLREKFRIPEYAHALRSTGTLPIYEDSPTDAVWGIGADGNGRNLLGLCLEIVRAELDGPAR